MSFRASWIYWEGYGYIIKMKQDKIDIIISHLEYLVSRVDAINGRVRETEKEVSKIKGIGSAITFVITTIIGVIGYLVI